jgi:hypothetical protein
VVELGEHLFDARARYRLQQRHGVPQLLHLLRPEMLEHLGRVVFAKRDQQNGAFLDAVFSWHWRRSIP